MVRRFKRRSYSGQSKRKFGGSPTAISLNAEMNPVPKKRGKEKTEQQTPVIPMMFVEIERRRYAGSELRDICRVEVKAKRSWPSFGHVPNPTEENRLLVRIRKLGNDYEISVMFFSKNGAWHRIPDSLNKAKANERSAKSERSAGGHS